MLIFDITSSQIENCRKKYSRPRYEVSENECIVSLAGVGQFVWALTTPTNKLCTWCVKREELVTTIDIAEHTPHIGEWA